MDTKALDDALDILINYTGMFLPEKFPLVQSAEAELIALKKLVEAAKEWRHYWPDQEDEFGAQSSEINTVYNLMRAVDELEKG